MKIIDLTGQKFGRLAVIARAGSNSKGNALWLCQCECGKEHIAVGWRLKNGDIKSCGCYRKEKITKHSMHGTRLYRIWNDINTRCYYEKHKSYNRYGGRGITVCDEWRNDFAAFYEWAMANGYADNLTIDRKDTNGNYEPSNCRWVTMKEQQNNRSNNRRITYNGETLTASQWAEKLGVARSTLTYRLNHWSIEKALSTP